jgi:hypothetical protein
MVLNTSDDVVVRFLESTLVLEQAALAAREFSEKQKDSQLRDLVLKFLDDAVADIRIRRRHFRYGHDCTEAKCDSDSHK